MYKYSHKYCLLSCWAIAVKLRIFWSNNSTVRREEYIEEKWNHGFSVALQENEQNKRLTENELSLLVKIFSHVHFSLHQANSDCQILYTYFYKITEASWNRQHQYSTKASGFSKWLRHWLIYTMALSSSGTLDTWWTSD